MYNNVISHCTRQSTVEYYHYHAYENIVNWLQHWAEKNYPTSKRLQKAPLEEFESRRLYCSGVSAYSGNPGVGILYI